jgi:predicted nucleic acid-binding protein
MNYIFDTNTVIYYLQKQFPENARNFVNNLLAEETPHLSVITEIELLCWKNCSEKDIEQLKNFIGETKIIDLEKDIKLKTAEIRKNHNIKLPDAIIAATSVVKGFPLITRNVADFQNIPDLTLQNPWEQ